MLEQRQHHYRRSIGDEDQAEMLKYRNFGKKSLNEIKEKLSALNLSLGMNLDPELLETPKEDNRLLMQ